MSSPQSAAQQPAHAAHGAGASAQRQSRALAAAARRRQHRTARRLLPYAAAAGAVLAFAAGTAGAPWWQCLLLAWAPAIVTARLVYQPSDTCWAAGAEGERRTAALLAPLRQGGWYVLHDRAIPASRSNADHIVAGPAGVLCLDSKYWSAKAAVRVRGGRLWHGRVERTQQLRTATWEAQQISQALGVAVATIVVVHGAEVPNGKITVNGVTVVGAGRLQQHLRTLTPTPGYDTERVRELAATAERAFPPYTA